jgi:hypothetical protein
MLLATACSHEGFKVSNSWNPKEAPFFDDGVDILKTMDNLSGRWAYARRNELDGRILLADLIAEVDVKSVQTFIDKDGKEAKRIGVSITNKLYGETPGKAISLVSQKDAPGHELLLRYEGQLTGKFFAFVRWFEIEDQRNPSIGHHFHMSPVSPEMTELIEKGVRARLDEEAAERAKQP